MHQRIFGLDFIRFIAILLVVLEHGAFILNDTFLEGFPFIPTSAGVDLFFVLSGFLIGGILLKQIDKAGGFTFSGLLHFWKRRWFRTLPTYYLILLVNYMLVDYSIINGDIEQADYSFLFFSQNLLSPFYDFFWESWSLSVEEWFYLLSPVLILVTVRFLNLKRAYILVSLLMIVIAILYRYSIRTDQIDKFWFDATFRKVVLCRIDSIGFGLIAAWVLFYYKVFWDRCKNYSALVGFILLSLIMNIDYDVQSFYQQVVMFSIIPFCMILFIPSAENWKSSKGVFATVVQFISKISYSMYLVNLAFVAQVIQKNFMPVGITDSFIKYILFWIVTMVLSVLIYRFYERPMMNLRDLDFGRLLRLKRRE